jgi:Flp pilus assembly protein TadB
MPIDQLQLISIAAFLLLSFVGFTTYSFALSRDINTDYNIRAVARIRRAFVDHYPVTQGYLTWRQDDEPTAWVTRNTSNVRRTAQTLLSVIVGAPIALVMKTLVASWTVAILTAIIGFGVMLVLIQRYNKVRFRAAEEAGFKTVRFPKVKGG